MHVIATAGHVDHGKSALLRALTGMEPDRLDEERDRGLTVDLGFVWTDGAAGQLAFVDVPGHERFIANMLAGIGSVPAVLFVVAADEGWMPQSAEHLLALDALGARRGLLAVTKSDLMDPSLATEEALDEIRGSSLGEVPAVAVSAVTGAGLPRLRDALDQLVDSMPAPDPAAPVRLWVDRSFTIRGAGLIVTGTLAAGTVGVGDTLELASTGATHPVRELQSLNDRVERATGTARVAMNLRGARRGDVNRGDALVTPGSYRRTTVADVRIALSDGVRLPREMLLHLATAMVSCTARPLGKDTARLTLRDALPLWLGDRVVLRTGRTVIGGATVLDVDPPALDRRGAARRRAGELAAYPDAPTGTSELRRRGIVSAAALRSSGVEPPLAPVAGDWLVDPDLHTSLRKRLTELVETRRSDPAAAPLTVDEARSLLDLPDARLVPPLVTPPLAVRNGTVVHGDAPDTVAPAVRSAVQRLAGLLPGDGFAVPSEADLQAVGLGPAEVSAAVRAEHLVRLSPAVVLLPDAVRHAVDTLAQLPQPFTASEARQSLGTTRRIAVPLLEHLARHNHTRRTGDGRHQVTGRR
ncbi:MAG: selenocysteine-specific translation elongation factor [Streptosporangiales bacterium]|nr:selenocysteine-specific translation elongation factor [Streptosporangiales bacterium]